METIQKRNILLPQELKIREAGEGEGESRIIEGYAVKFGVRSQLLQDYWEQYYEVIEAGAITRELLNTQDFVLTLYHDPSKVLARSCNGVGTLNWDVDEIGVKFWAEMPRTQWGDEALELVRRGDVDGCSFIYSTDENKDDCVSYDTETVAEGVEILIRTVHKIKKVYDLTLTYRPAYKQTECSARERDLMEKLTHPVPPTTNEETDEERHQRELAEQKKAQKARDAQRAEILNRHKKSNLFTL